MNGPWEEIDLDTYEKHMSLGSVFQLQALNKIMKGQLYAYPIRSVMILGIAGGNGLEHIDRSIMDKVYGVDINKAYLEKCVSRYPELQGVFEPIHADLTRDLSGLPYADLLIADLLVEYIGYDSFQKTVKKVSPKYVSVVIQINVDDTFVSDSPYIHAFVRLDEVHHQMEETALVNAMEEIGYKKAAQAEEALPNGKKLVRMDFTV